VTRPGHVPLAAVAALALAAMVVSLLRGEWLFDLYWYWWIPALGLCSTLLLTWITRRWWLLALAFAFLIPLIVRILFGVICDGGGNCI